MATFFAFLAAAFLFLLAVFHDLALAFVIGGSTPILARFRTA